MTITETKAREERQLNFYKVLAVPVLINRLDQFNIKSADMRFLRPAAGHTFKAQMKNEHTPLREKLIIYFYFTGKIEHREQNWREHLLRMHDDRNQDG
jgi:hypothetical protein